ncbi:Ran binding domain-containing protein [Lentinula edodes]|uniref:Ran binding domain-containing protein n=1 Tax=Lentinula edodes TaxID=5353 RepID=UPI001E8CF760|nr:Ran binding domain-containing protein [Lentinula edodes]XP_046080999.1 Ran binding domain-containing protein [Lentinula edodes]KAH7869467.1 Ran binding domain-containing protein [Lentinula edodes]KAH7869905.1 Ran binding domain-containing protein [Lentinula edodes]KAJ3886864.1 Ran binding domain-containing protein [Lentinula edodes]KAJ3903366.1 Ran binding domain-containing protein [Lentinula edodes]
MIRRAKLFQFDAASSEWKERGTGDVRLLVHKETKKMRQNLEGLHKLLRCVTFFLSADMRLQPNIGSDPSWVWKVAAEYSETPPTSETLAI